MRQVASRGEPSRTLDLAEHTLHRRAVEAALWGVPIVSVHAMRRAFFELGLHYGDIAYSSRPADWRMRITTPNSSSLYGFLAFNVTDGPRVLEIPAAADAGVFGSICDAWQVPIVDFGPQGEDRGRGGRYLLVPPAFAGELPPGHFPVRLATCNGYSAFRSVPVTWSEADIANAVELLRQVCLYPLAQAADPPPSRHVDIAGRLFDGIVTMDDTFFDGLAEMVSEEPVQTRDLVALGRLQSVGIEKGKRFEPDAATRAILRRAAAEAKEELVAGATRVDAYWPGTHWGYPRALEVGAATGFTFETETLLDVDARAELYFLACALPNKLGDATFYLLAFKAADGALLEGGNDYRLRVPADVPVRQFWAVTAYAQDDGAFIRKSPSTEINAYQELQRNADGSVDVFFGPEPRAGRESNWIYTARGKRWFAGFRFYGPEPAVREKTWTMGDIEKIDRRSHLSKVKS